MNNSWNTIAAAGDEGKAPFTRGEIWPISRGVLNNDIWAQAAHSTDKWATERVRTRLAGWNGAPQLGL
jgi:hypothetical protein